MNWASDGDGRSPSMKTSKIFLNGLIEGFHQVLAVHYDDPWPQISRGQGRASHPMCHGVNLIL